MTRDAITTGAAARGRDSTAPPVLPPACLVAGVTSLEVGVLKPLGGGLGRRGAPRTARA